MYLITIIPGIFRIYDRSADRIVGVISKQDVLNAQELPELDYEDLEKRLLSGSSKFSRKIKKLARYLSKRKKTLPVAIAKTLFPRAKPIIDVLAGSSVVGGRHYDDNYDNMYARKGMMMEGMGFPKEYFKFVKDVKMSFPSLTHKQALKQASVLYREKKGLKPKKRKRCPKGKRKVCKTTKCVKKGGDYMSKRQLLNRLMQY